jgi:glyoxylase-like metal-dependent hydrolase (beta-lactamase superfamily II)
LHEFERGPSVEAFAFGEELAPGITAHQLGVICPDDTALHIRTAGGCALADGLTRPRGGGLRFVPGFLMGDDASTVRAGLRESLRRLLDLKFDHVLFAHGDPLIGGGKRALREFVEQ